ncbi:protein O-linked-mannose beta-1,2-N-acetylglucosaminyltransferase 1-like isoform X1 [Amphiura filiformis]|uniref:protein O-linked-mannose beta-1,2-N-acetylglucosaminyltransferase 1-like isoform X1 n=1 Tax=Amphiura filiformis TaxID=82378 RepID=UPI003B210DE5
MWLIRKLIRVRVCQHAIASCLIILTFVLLSYVFQEDETEKNFKVNLQQQAGEAKRQQEIKMQQITKAVPIMPAYDIEAKCGNKSPCQRGQFAYHVRTGHKNKEKPYMCLDGKELMTPETMSRGLNIVRIQDPTHMQKITTQTFDLYDEDSSRLEAFLGSIGDGQLIIVVSFDDAAYQLSDAARKVFMNNFYSQHVYRLNYRGQWAFMGQKGMPLQGDIEKVNPFAPAPGVEWGDQLEIQGCIHIKEHQKRKPVVIQSGSLCDVKEECDYNSIPIHVESGEYHAGRKTLPRVCVNGELVLGNRRIGKEDPAKRGLNFVVFNPIDEVVVKIGRFDTYESPSDDREAAAFLQTVQDGHLVIGTVFDEATNQLSFETKGVLKNLGSTQIFALDYREMWVFIGQKGIDGATPYEKIGNKLPTSWGAKVDIQDCIPKQIEGTNSKVAASRKKKKFCEEYDGYPELCTEENLLLPVFPKPLDDISLQSNPAYSTPIVVIPGTDLRALERCLASLIDVPGIRPSNVMVMLEGSFAEPNDLVSLYGFRVDFIKSSANYQKTLINGIERSLTAFPGNEYIIILEEYVEVTPDFLHYFSQTLPLLDKDNTILTISAWNQNGFEHTSGDQHLLYRTEDFPGFGWVLRRKFYTGEIFNKNTGCCSVPTWRGWLLDDNMRKGRHSIVPDVSRVKRIKKDGFYEEKSFLDAYLANRKTSSGYLTEPNEVYKLVADEYDKELDRLVSRSTAMMESELSICLHGASLILQHEPDKGHVYAVYYQQDTLDDTVMLRKLATCFGLFVHNESHIRGVYKGLLRFTRDGNQYMLIGTQSPFYTTAQSQGNKVLPVIGNKSHYILRR